MDGAEAAAGRRDLLRAARRDRGWSQGAAARELAALAARGTGTAATTGSLKTQLSRWENGHATPAPEHRALLAELYGRTEAELGLGPPPARPGADGSAATDRLRAAVGAAAELDDEAIGLLTAQLRATAGLDHRLGTAAAHGALAAQVEHLRGLLDHCLHPEHARALAALLAEAALLAGDQERDRDVANRAWSAYAVAADAGRRAERDDLAATARERQVRLLHEADPGGAATVVASGPRGQDHEADGPRVDRQSPPVPLLVDVAHGPAVRDRLDTLLAAVDRDGADAATAAAEARRLALRTGSARALAVLDRRAAPP
ncbi:helix-turn-helix domain-containing protein [Pseudonocardia nantongensis]|uniref:helix-turn-helix domain-containing protein n=1 Tax=Pseudonocardia nantongensis TaxID=1181885 RepID=UPI00397A4CBE